MEDNNIIDKYFIDIKFYILSNKMILKILKEDEINEKWNEYHIYVVSSEEITKWKSEIGYSDICKELKKRKKIDINGSDKDWIISLISKNINNFNKHNNISQNNVRKNINNESIYNSYSSTFCLDKEKKYISFCINEENENNGNLQIKIGKNKIIILENKKIIILCLKEEYLNIKIEPYNLEKYLNEFIIEFDSIEESESNKILEEINKMNIHEFKMHIKNDGKRDIFNYSNYNLNIKKKEKIDISLYININLIIKSRNFNKINFEQVNEFIEILGGNYNSIKEIKYINTIIVKKPKNSSYIIASMYSLSQIPEFTDYFVCNKKNTLFKSDLLLNFKKYILHLWKKNYEREVYEPKCFMLILRKKNNIIFDLKKEKEPIIFLENIFDYINEELNNKDKDIEIKINETKKEFIPKYNSIIAKTFYGIYHINYLCSSCGEMKNMDLDNKIFKFIEININKYSNYQSELDNSLTFFYLDDLINFYFFEQDNFDENQEKNELNFNNNSSYCKICKKDTSSKKVKNIYKFPEIIIIWINWGNFSVDQGFNGLDSNKLIFNKFLDLTKYSSIDNSKDEIIYKIRSIINYPIVNENIQKDWKKFITFSRHLVNNKFYSYQPSGKVIEINKINRLRFVPSVLFYEKI